MPKQVPKLPKAERNFWIEGDVDGLKAPLKGGPATRDGGFNISLMQRDRGELKRVMQIIGKYDVLRGECVLEVFEVRDYESGGHSEIHAHSVVTQRDLLIV